jgi:hypothetical protein
MNTGSASTRELLFSFGVPRAATNLLSWDRRWKIHSPVIGNLKLDESVIWLRSGYEERFHVGDAIYFLGLCFQRFSDIYVLGAGVSVKTDTGDDRIWSLWFIPAQESDADSAILTGERATNALNSLDPRIIQSLESSQQIMTLWKEP